MFDNSRLHLPRDTLLLLQRLDQSQIAYFFEAAQKYTTLPETVSLDDFNLFEVHRLREAANRIQKSYSRRRDTIITTTAPSPSSLCRQALIDDGLPVGCADTICGILAGEQYGTGDVERPLIGNVPQRGPSSITLDWRIDVSLMKPQAICNTELSPKSNCTSVLVKINRPDDNNAQQPVVFVMDLPTFHKLRFGITQALQEIRTLRRSNRIPISD